MSIQPLSNNTPPAQSPPATVAPRVEAAPPKERGTVPANSAEQASPKDAPDRGAIPTEAVRQATQKVNDLITGLSSDLKFTVDEETGINVVKVVDIKTKEVIRQIPAQEMLQIAKRLDELQGLLIKDQA